MFWRGFVYVVPSSYLDSVANSAIVSAKYRQGSLGRPSKFPRQKILNFTFESSDTPNQWNVCRSFIVHFFTLITLAVNRVLLQKSCTNYKLLMFDEMICSTFNTDIWTFQIKCNNCSKYMSIVCATFKKNFTNVAIVLHYFSSFYSK